MSLEEARHQIIAALKHPEAEEGLYFDNFYTLHEEDERPRVSTPQVETLEALRLLISEGLVAVNEDSDPVIFSLIKN